MNNEKKVKREREKTRIEGKIVECSTYIII